MIYTHTKAQLPVREMRLELICAFLAIAMVTIGTSAVISGRQNDADDERSVRDALFSGGAVAVAVEVEVAVVVAD